MNGSGTGYVYRGSFVYSTAGSSEVLESVGFGGGRIEKNGTGYEVAYHITDHLGSVRSIVKNGTIVEQNDYYPFGGRLADSALSQQSSPFANRWRFSGKEDLSVALGDPVLDFGARMYSSTGAMWQTQDPLAEKYYGVSQYVYCNNSPTIIIDVQGDSLAVLNAGPGIGHIALLIQDSGGKWNYYSYNGTWVYKLSRSAIGGKPYHDVGSKSFNSPEEFLYSSYNAEGTQEQVRSDEVNNYGFKELYVLPTSPDTDRKVKNSFLREVNTRYSLFNHQCLSLKKVDSQMLKTNAILLLKQTRTVLRQGDAALL